MICDVCSHLMRRPATERSGQPVEDWVCPWCCASTLVGAGTGEVSRPAYRPVNLRWERADGEELSDHVSHAYGYFGRTLCGIHRAGITASPSPWIPEWSDACRACKEAAVVVDQRWPLNIRGADRVQGTPPPGSDWPPF